MEEDKPGPSLSPDVSIMAQDSSLPPTWAGWVEVNGADFARVIFSDVKEVYKTDTGIKCYFEFNCGDLVTADDYVGLYRVGYKDLSEVLTSIDVKSNVIFADCGKLCVIFKAKDLPKGNNDVYQFLYVHQGQVYGASTPFLLQATSDETSMAVLSDDDFIVVQSSEGNDDKSPVHLHKEDAPVMKEEMCTRDLQVMVEESDKLETKMKASLAKCKGNIFDALQQFPEVINKYENMLVEVGILKNLLDEKENNIKANEKLLEREKADKNALQIQMVELVAKNEELQKTIEEMKSDFAGKENLTEANHIAEIESLKKRIRSLEEVKVESLPSRENIPVSAQTLLLKQLESQDAMLRALDDSKLLVVKELNLKKGQVQLLENRVKSLTDEVAKLVSESQGLKIMLHKNDVVTESLKEANECLRGKEQERIELKEANQKLEDKVKSLTDKVEKSASEAVALKVVLKHHDLVNECLTKENEFLGRKLSKVMESKEGNHKAMGDFHILSVANKRIFTEANDLQMTSNMETKKANQEAHSLKQENEILSMKVEELLTLRAESEKAAAKNDELKRASILDLQQRLTEAADLYKKQFIEIRSLMKQNKRLQDAQKETPNIAVETDSRSSSISVEDNNANKGDFIQIRTSDSDTGEHVSRSNKGLANLEDLRQKLSSAMVVGNALQEQVLLRTDNLMAKLSHIKPSSNLVPQREMGAVTASAPMFPFEDNDDCDLYDSPPSAPKKEEESPVTNTIVCPNCPEVIPLPNGSTHFLLEHLREAHSEDVCPVCGMVFDISLPTQYFKFHVDAHFEEKDDTYT